MVTPATLNAALNLTSAVLLLAGLAAIRGKRTGLHVACLLGALAVTGAFLVSYVLYHLRVGSVHFRGTGAIRPVYFTILITHTVLAVAIVPLVARTLFLAGRRRFSDHVRWARVTFPLWFYVSVSGVAVYWFLYQSPWMR